MKNSEKMEYGFGQHLAEISCYKGG